MQGTIIKQKKEKRDHTLTEHQTRQEHVKTV